MASKSKTYWSPVTTYYGNTKNSTSKKKAVTTVTNAAWNTGNAYHYVYTPYNHYIYWSGRRK